MLNKYLLGDIVYIVSEEVVFGLLKSNESNGKSRRWNRTVAFCLRILILKKNGSRSSKTARGHGYESLVLVLVGTTKLLNLVIQELCILHGYMFSVFILVIEYFKFFFVYGGGGGRLCAMALKEIDQ